MAQPTDISAVRESPQDQGTVELIVRRPATGEREVVERAELSTARGLVGDHWSTSKPDPDPRAQLTLMNARAAAVLAGDRDLWPLAGNQLFVDLDLSDLNAPPGTRIAVGEAVIEITDLTQPGCMRFAKHFGPPALELARSPEGVELNLRGVNARVVSDGVVVTGDTARIVDADKSG
jgi:MOSC domain-containing protein YiiM